MKGQRRIKPPPGYMTSTEAVKVLGKMLYKHAENGHVRKIVPEGHKHGFYHAGDVARWAAVEQTFSDPYQPGAWRDNPTSSFEIATPQDMPAIDAISRALFGDPPPIAARYAWLASNPETFYVLRASSGDVIGYASVLPLLRATIERLVRDEIAGAEIGPGDIQQFTPGMPVDLYVMAVGIDGRFSSKGKHTYGAHLVAGLYRLLFDLAARGVEIATITARSQYRDGLRLLRKMGIPQIVSPVAGKSLFFLDVRTSGFSIFEQYRAALAIWQAQHAPVAAPVVAAGPRQRQRAGPLQGSSSLPDGLEIAAPFAKRHGIAESTINKAIDTGRLVATIGEWKAGRAIVRRALDQAGQRDFYTLYHENPRFTPCPDCPHIGQSLLV